ncbi:hypothetical protein LguiA_023033 [Lonicera macranthoides]
MTIGDSFSANNSTNLATSDHIVVVKCLATFISKSTFACSIQFGLLTISATEMSFSEQKSEKKHPEMRGSARANACLGE